MWKLSNLRNRRHDSKITQVSGSGVLLSMQQVRIRSIKPMSCLWPTPTLTSRPPKHGRSAPHELASPRIRLAVSKWLRFCTAPRVLSGLSKVQLPALLWRAFVADGIAIPPLQIGSALRWRNIFTVWTNKKRDGGSASGKGGAQVTFNPLIFDHA
jgi:hypothetical protein